MTTRTQRRIGDATALRMSAVVGCAIGLACTISSAHAQSSECLIDTYPPDGGVLQGSTIYAFFRQPNAPYNPCKFEGWSPVGESDAHGLVPAATQSAPGQIAFTEVSGFETGLFYRGTIRLDTRANSSDPQIEERSLSFTVEELGEVFDPATITVDRAEAVIDEPNRLAVITIEGRWPGPTAHHFVFFYPDGWSGMAAFPDAEQGGAFKIVYERPLVRDDLRRSFSLSGKLLGIYPDASWPGTPIDLPLLEDVDLRHLRQDTRGCASSPGAAWPLAGLAAMLLSVRRARRRS